MLTQQQGLATLLKQKNCFKLICGAGNENLQEIERLVAVYAAAGCRFFDLANDIQVLQAAQRGLDFAIPKEEQTHYLFCVSIGTKGDQHVQKAVMKARGQEGRKANCLTCGDCVRVCPQSAIRSARGQEGKRASIEIFEKYCIGCGKCVNVCSKNLIELKTNTEEKTCLPALLPSCPLACIELHASDTNENEVDEIWDDLNKNFDGMLSICLGRGKLSNERVLNRIKRFIAQRKPYTIIIQADGSPMSGGADDYKTTLQAVAMAEIIQNEKLPVYLILSGGTNSKTAELAKLCAVDINGIAFGSYARKIVREYIDREDFFENKEIFSKAQQAAKSLIDSTFV